MRNIFRTGRPYAVTYTTQPTGHISRAWRRWQYQFQRGKGPLFWAAAIAASVGLYALLWLSLALA